MNPKNIEEKKIRKLPNFCQSYLSVYFIFKENDSSYKSGIKELEKIVKIYFEELRNTFIVIKMDELINEKNEIIECLNNRP